MSAQAMEEPGSLQLLSKWPCQGSEGLASLMAYINPSHEKAPIFLGLGFGRLLLCTVCVWLGKLRFAMKINYTYVGGGCSHSAAIMFKVECTGRNQNMRLESRK